jgi:signal transduction histidine kinase
VQQTAQTRESGPILAGAVRKLTIAAIAAGILFVMGGVRVSDLQAARRDALEAAVTRADNLALVLSAYVGESFRAADASLRQLQLHSRRVGGPRAAAEEWRPSLTSAKAGLTGVGAITVVDREGIIHHSTRPEIIGQSRRGEYLTRQTLAATSDDLVVGTPFQTQSFPDAPPTQVIIPIARRLVRGDGVVEGAIVASFRPEAPRALLREVTVGARGTISVFHPAGVVLFREPAVADAIGESAAGNPIFAAARERPSGVLERPLGAGGPVMLTAFRVTTTPPLVVAVSAERDEVLAAWRREAVDSALVFGVLSVVLATVLVILFRQMDATAAAQRAVLDRERELRRNAEDANALKDDFLMNVSHELRTPLTAIQGWARMLSQGAVAERNRERAIRTIERNAEAQRRLIEDLIDVSADARSTLRVEIHPVQAADVIRNAIDASSIAAAAKSIRIDDEVDPHIGEVRADAARLLQIVSNLVANAIKFTPEGGRVCVRATRASNELVITVSDTGVGISPVFLPYVFDRFRQEDTGPTRQFSGLGVGLSIARSLVELHGGAISAASDGPGTGATFVVRLPIDQAHAAGATA